MYTFTCQKCQRSEVKRLPIARMDEEFRCDHEESGPTTETEKYEPCLGVMKRSEDIEVTARTPHLWSGV